MKCNKCSVEIPSEYEFILQQNVCPKCGAKLMAPKAMEIYIDLKKKLDSIEFVMDKKIVCERIAMFMINNYEVIPLTPLKSAKSGGAPNEDVFRVQDEVLNGDDLDLSVDEIRAQEAFRAENIATARDMGFNVDDIGDDEEMVGTSVNTDRMERLRRLASSNKSGVVVNRRD